jgi:putative ABC transport system permease protein
MAQVVDGTLADRRLSMMLLSLFAAVAMLLAAVGIYGLLSYAISQRMPEIGVRIALGARLGDIRHMVLWRSTKLVVIGVLIGGAAAYAVSGWLATQLYGVTSTDMPTFALVTVTLLVVALVASYLPARRATRVDPVKALRSE